MAKLKSLDTEYLKETLKYSLDTFEKSQREAQECRDMYTNRQYTAEQINVLNSRGQPVETFNIVLMMTRAITGFLDRVQNRPQIKPRTIESNDVASALNDYCNYVLDNNRFDQAKHKLQLDALTSGLMVLYTDVIKTGKKDKYGRDVFKLKLGHVPSYQVGIDPMSTAEDGSDSRFFHRFKWISKDNLAQLYGKGKLEELTANTNYINREVTDKDMLSRTYGYSGVFNVSDKYLVVHSIIREDNGDMYSVQWSEDTILLRNKVTFKDVPNPYAFIKMNDNFDEDEFYGPFREVVESQKAINQALIQIQLLINTSKAFVESDAVEDLDKFKEAFSRVNTVVEVEDLNGVKVEDMSRDILDQYVAIDKALERIKSVLGINDSFLGNAYASDSGRKVQIQSSFSAGMMSYVTRKMEILMQTCGHNIVSLARQYISAEEVLRTSDFFVGDRYFTINKPVMEPVADPETGVPLIDPNTGEIMLQPVMEPVIDPATGEFVINEANGAIALAPLGDPTSTLDYADVDVIVESVPVDNTNEKDQLVLETVINGPIGQALLQTNPAGYMMASSLSLRNYGAKYSNIISDILQQTALRINNGQLDPTLAMAGGNMQAILGGAMGGSNGNQVNGPSSQTAQIPTGMDQGGPKGEG